MVWSFPAWHLSLSNQRCNSIHRREFISDSQDFVRVPQKFAVLVQAELLGAQ